MESTRERLIAMGLTSEQVSSVIELMNENPYITVEGLQALVTYQAPLMGNHNAHNFVMAWFNYNMLESFTKEQRHIISNVMDHETRSIIFWLKGQGYIRQETGYTKTYHATDKLITYVAEFKSRQ